MTAAAVRMTADERRDALLDVAREHFAGGGFHGTSTEAIAGAAGISQPYVFRLFGTKKGLFVACVRRSFRETLETFQRAAEGRRGADALAAAGAAYTELLTDRTALRLQLHAYAAAADDEEVREVVREGFGDIVSWAERVGGVPPADVSRFFGHGMLLNVIAAMDLLESNEAWAARLVEGCRV